jgi:acetylornithine deacetylase
MEAKEKKILETADRLFEQTLDFTARLVAEASTLGNEMGAATVMEAELQALGLETCRVFMDTPQLAAHPGYAPVPWPPADRFNVVGRLPDRDASGRSALFNGHLDVVSPEPLRFWRRDPFMPEIKDGWLYGRGAGDMKSGVAAMTYAVHTVRQAGFALGGPVTVAAVIEEECSGNGALACLAAGYDADAVLIPEPFGPTLLTDQVGVLWFKVVLNGVPTHVQAATAGVNAIEACYPLMEALHRLEVELNRTHRPEAYRDHPHPLNLNIGILKGGDWPSTVPADAEFHARLSYFPGVPYAEMQRRILAAIKAQAEKDPWLARHPPTVEFYGFRSDGHHLSRDEPALRTLNACHRDLTGQDAETYVSTCTTDLRAFTGFGKGQATCFGPVAERIHADNERVTLESVRHVLRTYALFLARWCGLYE